LYVTWFCRPSPSTASLPDILVPFWSEFQYAICIILIEMYMTRIKPAGPISLFLFDDCFPGDISIAWRGSYPSTCSMRESEDECSMRFFMDVNVNGSTRVMPEDRSGSAGKSTISRESRILVHILLFHNKETNTNDHQRKRKWAGWESIQLVDIFFYNKEPNTNNHGSKRKWKGS
jgi:hypothetical protein